MKLYSFYVSFMKGNEPNYGIRTIESTSEHLARRSLLEDFLKQKFQVVFIKLSGKDAIFNPFGN